MPSGRASLRASVLMALAGVLLALTGAGRPWARVSSAVELAFQTVRPASGCRN